MVEPFLKWAGGKRWLVKRHGEMFPVHFGRYIEPFLGSGAVFFHLQPKQATLADKNGELIATYKAVRKYPDELTSRLAKYHKLHSVSFYYEVRKTMPSCEIEQAVRFLYLNRVCFNGLYRVNLRGEFNVPIGSKVEVMFPNGFLRAISDRLRHARLMESDFEAVIAQAGRNDFVFIDPPYTVTHNNNGFIKYNDVLFSWEDQIRLAKAAMSAKRRGSLVFVSNADHAAVRELYDGFHFHHQLSRASILSAASSARKRTSESAFLSYRPSSSLSP